MAAAGAHEEPLPSRFHLDQRISHRHSRGTIRFIGELNAASSSSSSLKGQWLGIEWDDRQRGKHWGEFQGCRYFTCRFHRPRRDDAGERPEQGQKAEKGPASFLRPTAPGLKTGTSVLHALKHKYGPSTSPSLSAPSEGGGAQLQERYSRKNLAEIEIEFPDLDKVKRKVANVAKLRVAGLQGKVLPSLAAEASREDGTTTEMVVEDEEEEMMLVSSIVSLERGERPGDLKGMFPSRSCTRLSARPLLIFYLDRHQRPRPQQQPPCILEHPHGPR